MTFGLGDLARGERRHTTDCSPSDVNRRLTQHRRRLDEHYSRIDLLEQTVDDMATEIGEMASRMSALERRLVELHVAVARPDRDTDVSSDTVAVERVTG